MGFALAWRARVAAGLSRRGARTGASGSVRDRDAGSVVAVERLKRRSDFRAAATGLRASGSAFVVQARRRADGGAVRIGFTVSRQVGDAVERNRVRRRLREIVRMSAATGAGGLRPGHDYVLIGRRAALAAPFGEMMRELDAALSRIHAPEHGGTGAARRDPLHEAGSPSRSQKPRRNRKQPRESFQSRPKCEIAPRIARIPAARALNDRAQEHHPRHRAVVARRGRLAIFHRLSADGKAAPRGAAQAAGAGAPTA